MRESPRGADLQFSPNRWQKIACGKQRAAPDYPAFMTFTLTRGQKTARNGVAQIPWPGLAHTDAKGAHPETCRLSPISGPTHPQKKSRYAKPFQNCTYDKIHRWMAPFSGPDFCCHIFCCSLEKNWHALCFAISYRNGRHDSSCRQ